MRLTGLPYDFLTYHPEVAEAARNLLSSNSRWVGYIHVLVRPHIGSILKFADPTLAPAQTVHALTFKCTPHYDHNRNLVGMHLCGADSSTLNYLKEFLNGKHRPSYPADYRSAAAQHDARRQAYLNASTSGAAGKVTGLDYGIDFTDTLACQNAIQQAMLRLIQAWKEESKPPLKGVQYGEIIAWRCWYVKDNHLHSTFKHTKWPHDKPMESKLTPHDIGIHAFKEFQQIQEYVEDYSFTLVFGTVALWGEVTIHEHGYTAQFAQPKWIFSTIKGARAWNEREEYGWGHYDRSPDLDALRKAYDMKEPHYG